MSILVLMLPSWAYWFIVFSYEYISAYSSVMSVLVIMLPSWAYWFIFFRHEHIDAYTSVMSILVLMLPSWTYWCLSSVMSILVLSCHHEPIGAHASLMNILVHILQSWAYWYILFLHEHIVPRFAGHFMISCSLTYDALLILTAPL
jgi:hypothetical protein